MRIKVIKKSYQDVLAITPKKNKKIKKPNIFFRTVLKLVALPDLWATKFKLTKVDMDKLGKREPCLVLMNHSSFIDLEIVASSLYPRPFNIVATTDSFVGKNWLMQQIGCIPTKKFVFDLSLIRDIKNTLTKLGSSVVMYPEASYSFDGTATTLPETLGRFLKMLNVPVVMIRTHGAFIRDPLYNGLQRRKVKVSAEMKYLLSPEDIKAKSAEELDAILKAEFSFDNFREQQKQKIKVDAPFRADLLNRVLYKCPHCGVEGDMLGESTTIVCRACGAGYELDELGYLVPLAGEGKFNHIPDWYAWERECVRREIEDRSYNFSADVKILMAIDTHGIYDIGEGHLTHNADGFVLTGADGALNYTQKVQASYCLYSDFYWYQIGDVICIGNSSALYYCFPTDCRDFAAKIRLAAEELYKAYSEKKKSSK